jgi:hypothetical protein
VKGPDLSSGPSLFLEGCGSREGGFGFNQVEAASCVKFVFVPPLSHLRWWGQLIVIVNVEKAEEAGIQVVLLTATVIQEKLENAENAKLAPYNDYLRRLAREKKLRLADRFANRVTVHPRISP